MLSQKTFLEAIPVHRLDHGLQQAREISDEPLEPFVIRVLQ
jgi:hypothetical protein